MEQTNVLKKIVETFHPNIPVFSIEGEVSSVYSRAQVSETTGLVEKLTIHRFEFGNKDASKTRLLPYLPSHMAKVAEKYNPHLFTILHEIGHSFTYIGINLKEEYFTKAWISLYNSPALADKEYREVESERRADKWAYDWMVENKKLAKKFSDMLDNAGYK